MLVNKLTFSIRDNNLLTTLQLFHKRDLIIYKIYKICINIKIYKICIIPGTKINVDDKCHK